MIKLSVNETKWSSLLARTRPLILYISIWIFDFRPVKLPGLSRNGPLGAYLLFRVTKKVLTWGCAYSKMGAPFMSSHILASMLPCPYASLFIRHGQSVSGHVVQRRCMWGLDKNPQKWDTSETSHTVVYKTSVSHFKVTWDQAQI